MIIGLLSDTHGDAVIARTAVRLLLDAGAGSLVHCGDVGGEAVLDAMAGVPSAFVFGNNDYDAENLRRYAESIGIDCLGDYGGIRHDDKWVFVTHGDDPRVVKKLCDDPGTDYLLSGHSHQTHDRRVGRVRWINPGALYRAKVKTCATLDLTTDTLRIITVAARTG